MFFTRKVDVGALFETQKKQKVTADQMEQIAYFHHYKVKTHPDAFYIDDITWNDLEIDDVFKKVSIGLSSAGEQVLYHRLRTPMLEEAAHDAFRKQVDAFKEDSMKRSKVMKQLLKLGHNQKVQMADLFEISNESSKMFWFYFALMSGLIASIVGVFFSQMALLPLIFFLCVNPLVHRMSKTPHVQNVNYAAQMIKITEKLLKVLPESFEAEKNQLQSDLVGLKKVKRMGGVYIAYGTDIIDILMGWTMVDLLAYYVMRKMMLNKEATLVKIFECIGTMEVAISVAAFETRYKNHVSVPQWTHDGHQLEMSEMLHLNVENCVKNDAHLKRSTLITGSNASGKSTYIKAIGVNIVLAQSLSITMARHYRGGFCKLYTSMALRDDLSKNDSYYMAEIKSINRIVKASKSTDFIVCIVDEILRGTNTIERVAASSKILETLTKRGVLCITATHDIELCQLLADDFNNCHFEETVTESDIHFDYKVKQGIATTRNAIKLLSLIGFEAALVRAAEDSATYYDVHKRWR